MQREIANQQTSSGPLVGIADAVVHRINHPDFPANCRRVDGQISQSADVFDNAAANFLEVLGGCQLLGAKPDANVASMGGLDLNQRTKPSTKKQLELQLTVGNIWVRNGTESYGLVSLRFTDHRRAVSFLGRNPDLARTLIMAAKGEILVLFLLEGAKLVSLDLAGLRIQADGEILLFDRSPGAVRRYFIQYRRPVTTDLRKLKWDPDHEATLLPTIIEAFDGSFSRSTARGKRVSNYKAWASYIFKTTHIVFSRVDGHFYLLDEGPGNCVIIDRSELESMIESCIKKSPLSNADKAVAVDPLHIVKVIGRLKRLAAGESPVFDQVMLEFISRRLTSAQRSKANGHKEPTNLTVGELEELCREYAIKYKKRVVPVTVFQRRIARLMSGSPLYLPKSQSVKRNGKNQNGFRGVRVKPNSAN